MPVLREDELEVEDFWIECNLGHTHWGLYGAAGLMLRHVDSDGQEHYLLTHRSKLVQHGDTYSLPGGAIDAGETPQAGALREAQEELGQLPRITFTQTHVADHGRWAYHTIHGDVEEPFDVEFDEDEHWETNSCGWFTPQEIDLLNLHPGFREYWMAFRVQLAS